MKIKATIVLAMFGLATVLTACGGSQEEEMATYCVDSAGVVVDEEYCDPDSDLFNSTYLFWYSNDDRHYKKGKKIPSADFRKGTTSAPTSAKPSSKGGATSGSKPSANKPAPAPKPAPKPAPAPKKK